MARVHRGVVVGFGVVCAIALLTSVLVVASVGTAEGDEAGVWGTLAVLAASVVACGIVLVRARLVVTGDGRLVKGALRHREVDLTDLRAVDTRAEQPSLGDRPFALTLEDGRGRKVTLAVTFSGWIYDREAEVLSRVAEAVERAEVPLPGVVRNYLSQAAGRPVGEAAASERAAPARVEACVRRFKLWLYAGITLVFILFPLGPLLGGTVGPEAAGWVRPTGVASVGAGVIVWLAVVALHARRRLVIDEHGRMRVDGLLRRRVVHLADLTSVRLVPDKPVYEHNQHAPPAGRIPRAVLSDRHGHQARLRADDFWQPAQPVFARILDAADGAGVVLSEHAVATLRYLAGRAQPRIWSRRS